MNRAFVVSCAIVVMLVGASQAGCLSLSNRYRTSLAVQTASDLAYVDDGDPKHRLDIFAPSGAQGAPVVVFVHGGFWRSQDKRYFEPVVGLYGNVGVALADMGIVTVIPSYRLFPQAQSFEEQLDDVAQAVRFTRDHIAVHGGDPNKIVLAGHSAGGHLVAYLGTSPDALTKRGLDQGIVKGTAALSGIYDVLTSANNADPPEDKVTLWDPFFGSDDEKRAASPLAFFGIAPHAPIMLVIGELDFKNCLRDYKNGVAALTPGDVRDPRLSTVFVKGNTHEDMVLEIGTRDDEVGPAVAAFARVVTATH